MTDGWIIPEPITGNGEKCLTMTVPDNQLYIAAVVGAIHKTGQWFNWEQSGFTGDTRATETAAVMRRYIFDTLKISECKPEPTKSDTSEAQDVSSGFGDIHDLLQLMENLDVKYRLNGKLYEPVFDLVECGCGEEEGEGDTINDTLPGSTSGEVTYDGQPRVIDICSNVDVFIDAINDYIDEAQILNYVPGINQVSEGLEVLLGVSLQELNALEAELSDPKVATALKRWVVKNFDDPFYGFTRELLRTLTFRLPLIVGGTLFMPIFRIWAETADIQQLNAQLNATAGTATYDGECANLQRQFGREPYQPPTQEGLIVLDGENYKYTRVFKGTSELNGGFNIDVTGDDFVGFLINQKVNRTPTTGTGTTFTHSQSFTHSEGQTNISGSVGSGSTPSNQFYGSGIQNVGQIAFGEFPSEFVGWETFTNNSLPLSAAWPAMGAFTGTVLGNNNLDTTTELTVWIVTALSGNAQATP